MDLLQHLVIKDIIERQSLENIQQFGEYIEEVKQKKMQNYVCNLFPFLDINKIYEIQWKNKQLRRLKIRCMYDTKTYIITINNVLYKKASWLKFPLNFEIKDKYYDCFAKFQYYNNNKEVLHYYKIRTNRTELFDLSLKIANVLLKKKELKQLYFSLEEYPYYNEYYYYIS